MDLKINSEYAELVPPLSIQEYEALKRSISEKGFWKSNPIVVNKEGIILDGHHRYKACKELQVEPITTTAELFDGRLEEKLYVINSNLTASKELNLH